MLEQGGGRTDLSLGGCEEQCPGGGSQVQAVDDTGNEDGLQVPGIGCGAGNHPVLGQSNHGTIVEHSQQHNQQSGEVPAACTIVLDMAVRPTQAFDCI